MAQSIEWLTWGTWGLCGWSCGGVGSSCLRRCPWTSPPAGKGWSSGQLSAPHRAVPGRSTPWWCSSMELECRCPWGEQERGHGADIKGNSGKTLCPAESVPFQIHSSASNHLLHLNPANNLEPLDYEPYFLTSSLYITILYYIFHWVKVLIKAVKVLYNQRVIISLQWVMSNGYIMDKQSILVIIHFSTG